MVVSVAIGAVLAIWFLYTVLHLLYAASQIDSVRGHARGFSRFFFTMASIFRGGSNHPGYAKDNSLEAMKEREAPAAAGVEMADMSMPEFALDCDLVEGGERQSRLDA